MAVPNSSSCTSGTLISSASVRRSRPMCSASLAAIAHAPRHHGGVADPVQFVEEGLHVTEHDEA